MVSGRVQVARTGDRPWPAAIAAPRARTVATTRAERVMASSDPRGVPRLLYPGRRKRPVDLPITHICGMQPWACAERPGLEPLSGTDTHRPGARWIVPAGMPLPG